MRKCVGTDGRFNFGAVFADESGKASSQPLKLEICSGAGEWAVAQAQADPSSNYVTLELRHDRVYQTFYRAVCAKALNLCAIGGDANVVLAKHIVPNSLSNIFINHPEPPQQTGGTGSQGKHLLTLDFFVQATQVLRPGGVITIVTDNNWYARFLIRLLATAPHPRSLAGVELSATSGCKSVEEEGGYRAYLGKPGKECGHAVDASSYFDRLWKRGNLVDRYVIVLKKITGTGDASALRIRQYKKGAAPVDVDTQAPTAKKIKFDD
jgi:tRNA G46 methylase TrmB